MSGLSTTTLAKPTPKPEPDSRTYANPVDIDYRYNFEQLNVGISYRTGADPVIVRHGDAYYLFQTLADGYWRSTNLIDWTFIAPNRWPFESMVAPTAISDGDRLLLMQSMFTPGAVLVTRDPEHGQFDFLTRKLPKLPNSVSPGRDRDLLPWHMGEPQPVAIPPGPWDPAFFKDDDGRWYLYWGSSDTFPLYGIELDMREGMRYIGEPRALVALEPQRHGWERFGQDHRGATLADGKPAGNYIEGAWMNKVGGRYYLQYGAPGTEYNAYATGVYVGDDPLGPFEYAPYNPVGYKPGGFVQGAGHGSTFQDAHGNWWNTGTPWLGYNWNFERRIAMFPAAFSEDGQMSVSTRFGDFPHYIPEGPNEDPERLFTGWMLLSYRKPATASSTLEKSGAESFAAENVTDENPRTFWVAGGNEAGQTLTLDLGSAKTLCAVQVNFADYQSGRYGDADDVYTEFALQYSRDGKQWQPLADTGKQRRDRPNAYFQLPSPVRARYVRYVHGHVGAAHLAISDVRVFGNADGKAPAAPAAITAVRDADPRAVAVRWREVSGAVGYNVRWGVAPDRLYSTYQIFADQGTHLELRALNVGVSYFVAVEAFDENGVSRLSKVVAVP
ncbi:family 43 glycosylhydrolase [Pseudoxanthomonas sp. UTMC 1351]|uniref:family 43 glycosylhydrolase n=1 Tax=Pseudoxanthomonas sp. UTMC 1351 TaxID=2695853 RepID=UPI0034CF243E